MNITTFQLAILSLQKNVLVHQPLNQRQQVQPRLLHLLPALGNLAPTLYKEFLVGGGEWVVAHRITMVAAMNTLAKMRAMQARSSVVLMLS